MPYFCYKPTVLKVIKRISKWYVESNTQFKYTIFKEEECFLIQITLKAQVSSREWDYGWWADCKHTIFVA